MDRANSGLRAIALGLLGLLLVACQSNDGAVVEPLNTVEPSPAPTAPATPTPSPTQAPDDPYAIPDDPADIDEAYVQRVLDALAEVQGETYRRLVIDGRISTDVEAITEQAYAFDAYTTIIQTYEEILERDPELARFHDDPGDPQLRVESIIHAGRECTFLEVVEDLGAVLIDGGISENRQFYALGPYNQSRGTADGNLNPTPWKFSLTFGLPPDAADPENLCEGYD